jgi:hypothetical protein
MKLDGFHVLMHTLMSIYPYSNYSGKSYGKVNESLPIPKLKDKDEYKVEDVRDKKLIKGETYFLVK